MGDRKSVVEILFRPYRSFAIHLAEIPRFHRGLLSFAAPQLKIDLFRQFPKPHHSVAMLEQFYFRPWRDNFSVSRFVWPRINLPFGVSSFGRFLSSSNCCANEVEASSNIFFLRKAGRRESNPNCRPLSANWFITGKTSCVRVSKISPKPATSALLRMNSACRCDFSTHITQAAPTAQTFQAQRAGTGEQFQNLRARRLAHRAN